MLRVAFPFIHSKKTRKASHLSKINSWDGVKIKSQLAGSSFAQLFKVRHYTDSGPLSTCSWNTPSTVGQFVEQSTWWTLISKIANTQWLNKASFFYYEGLKWERHVSMVSLIYDQEALKSALFSLSLYFTFCLQNCYQAPKVTRKVAIKARAEQCTKFDNTSFNGYFFTWIPYLRGKITANGSFLLHLASWANIILYKTLKFVVCRVKLNLCSRGPFFFFSFAPPKKIETERKPDGRLTEIHDSRLLEQKTCGNR